MVQLVLNHHRGEMDCRKADGRDVYRRIKELYVEGQRRDEGMSDWA